MLLLYKICVRAKTKKRTGFRCNVGAGGSDDLLYIIIIIFYSFLYCCCLFFFALVMVPTKRPYKNRGGKI